MSDPDPATLDPCPICKGTGGQHRDVFAAPPDPAAPVPAVAGRFDRSFADFERACLVLLDEEQRRANPDNAVIAVLCDAVRLVREQVAPLLPIAPAGAAVPRSWKLEPR